MNKKRVFISMALPESAVKTISQHIEKISENFTRDVRFVPQDNWHITVSFLAYQSDDDISKILKAMEELGAETSPPLIQIANISYGPVGKPPKMIWANASEETSKSIEKIKRNLEIKLRDNGIRFEIDAKKYNGHITLARFENYGIDDLPSISKTLNIEFTAQSLDLMESSLKKAGAEYEILSKVEFLGESD